MMGSTYSTMKLVYSSWIGWRMPDEGAGKSYLHP